MSEENPNEKKELDVSSLVSKLKESVQQPTGMKNEWYVCNAFSSRKLCVIAS